MQRKVNFKRVKTDVSTPKQIFDTDEPWRYFLAVLQLVSLRQTSLNFTDVPVSSVPPPPVPYANMAFSLSLSAGDANKLQEEVAGAEMRYITHANHSLITDRSPLWKPVVLSAVSSFPTWKQGWCHRPTLCTYNVGCLPVRVRGKHQRKKHV